MNFSKTAFGNTVARVFAVLILAIGTVAGFKFTSSVNSPTESGVVMAFLSSGEGYADATIDFSLFLNRRDRDFSDFGGVVHMGAAARLKV